MGIDKISIIIPMYNAENFIKHTIQSVVKQSYLNWEIIVIDDLSTDKSIESVLSLKLPKDKLKLIKLEKKFGAPAGPRNIGVKNATGSWIAFLDADDIWHPLKLEYQMKAIIKHTSKFCSTKMQNFLDLRDISVRTPSDNIISKEITFAAQLKRFRTPTSSVIIHKDLMIKFPFNEDISYKAREDFLCWLKIHEYLGKSIKLDFPFMFYRISENQISGSKSEMMVKTLKVLKEYKFNDGSSMGLYSYYYLFTHILYSLYFRLIKKEL